MGKSALQNVPSQNSTWPHTYLVDQPKRKFGHGMINVGPDKDAEKLWKVVNQEGSSPGYMTVHKIPQLFHIFVRTCGDHYL